MRNQYKILAEVYNNQVNEATRANLPGMQQFKTKIIDMPWGKPALLLIFDKNGEFLHSTTDYKLVNVPKYKEHLNGLFNWIIPNVAAAMVIVVSGGLLITPPDSPQYVCEVYVTDPNWIKEIHQLLTDKISTDPNNANYSAKVKDMWDQLSAAVRTRLQEYRRSNPVNEATRANLKDLRK